VRERNTGNNYPCAAETFGRKNEAVCAHSNVCALTTELSSRPR
jgi:hypothetical protein